MKTNCPFTGISWKLAGLDNLNTTAPHPVIMLPRRELNKQFIRMDNNSTTENYLLWMAALVGTKLVQFTCPLPASVVSQQLISATSANLVAIYNWIHDTPDIVDKLPKFRVTPELVHIGINYQIATFIREIAQVYKYGRNLRSYSENTCDDPRIAAQEKKEQLRAITAAKIHRQKSFPLVVQWAFRNLELDSQVDDTHCRVLRALFEQKEKSFHYPLSVIREVRGVCLEHLPENNHDNFLRKQELVQEIDKIILSRAEVLSALGTDEDTTMMADIVDDISRSYSIEMNGETFLNSANPVAKHIRDAKDILSVPATEQKEVSATEPKESEYPNRLAYLAAFGRWKKSQENV